MSPFPGSMWEPALAIMRKYNISPNPANDHIYADFEAEQIEPLDMAGGVYLLRFKNGWKTEPKK